MKRIRGLLVVLLLALIFSGTSVAVAQEDKRAEADRLYAEGLQLYHAGNFKEAQRKFVASLEIQKSLKVKELTTITSHDTIGIFEHFYQLTPTKLWGAF